MCQTTASPEQAPAAADGFAITKQWLLAGNAIFTANNDKGNHYTFKISLPRNWKPGERKTYFVSMLYKPDNSNDGSYLYLGVLDVETGTLRATKKSRFPSTGQTFKIAQWAIAAVWYNRTIPAGYGINGAGRCGRCGRMLTRPEGIDPAGYRFGFGPDCWQIIQGGE